MNDRMRIAFACSLAAFFSCANANALTAIAIPDANILSIVSPNNTVWGFEFSPLVNIEVTSFGIYDVDGDGLSDTHSWAIWDDQGNVITQQLFFPGSGTPLINGFRYIDITPVALDRNQRYIAGVFYPGTSGDAVALALFDDSFASHPLIDVLGGRHGTGIGFEFPGERIDETPLGPNFRFSAVPVPAAAYLMFSGLLVFFGLRKG